jgi:rhodanese-related sulfurtransferase
MLQISAKALAKKLCSGNPPHLLDVRDDEEYAVAALPEATLIPLAQLPYRATEIAHWKEQEVVVYCHHGVRSLQAIRLLQGLGFNKLANLTGGIDRWAVEVDKQMKRY